MLAVCPSYSNLRACKWHIILDNAVMLLMCIYVLCMWNAKKFLRYLIWNAKNIFHLLKGTKTWWILMMHKYQTYMHIVPWLCCSLNISIQCRNCAQYVVVVFHSLCETFFLWVATVSHEKRNRKRWIEQFYDSLNFNAITNISKKQKQCRKHKLQLATRILKLQHAHPTMKRSFWKLDFAV